MPYCNVFPRAVAAAVLISLSAIFASAQTGEVRPRLVSVVSTSGGSLRLENEPSLPSPAPSRDLTRPAMGLVSPPPIRRDAPGAAPRLTGFRNLLLSAIDQRLGAPYVWGAAGPNVFDCSGFVWSAFQAVGVHFDRESARRLWEEFSPATPAEETQFGTLVFFNGLSHVGIVADANGFYHASRTRGVVYSPFNDYWLARLDGFRRVPLPPAVAGE